MPGMLCLLQSSPPPQELFQDKTKGLATPKGSQVSQGLQDVRGRPGTQSQFSELAGDGWPDGEEGWALGSRGASGRPLTTGP